MDMPTIPPTAMEATEYPNTTQQMDLATIPPTAMGQPFVMKFSKPYEYQCSLK